MVDSKKEEGCKVDPKDYEPYVDSIGITLAPAEALQELRGLTRDDGSGPHVQVQSLRRQVRVYDGVSGLSAVS